MSTAESLLVIGCSQQKLMFSSVIQYH